MPGVVRKTDICSGHGTYYPRINTESSPDTYTNSIQTTRFMDQRMCHSMPYPHVGHNIGIHDVYVNNRFIQTAFDMVDCSSTQIQSSFNVFVN